MAVPFNANIDDRYHGIYRKETTYFPQPLDGRRHPPPFEAFGAARYGDESNQEHNKAVRPPPFAVQAGSDENMYYRRHERSPTYGVESQDSHFADVSVYAQQKTRPHVASTVGAEALTWVATPVLPASGTTTLAAVRRSLLEGGGRAVVGFHRALMSHATGSSDTIGAAELGACLRRFAPSSQEALNRPGAPAALCQALEARSLATARVPGHSQQPHTPQGIEGNGPLNGVKAQLNAARVAAACTFALSDASRRLALSVWHRIDFKGFGRAPLQALLNSLATSTAPVASPSINADNHTEAQGGSAPSPAAAWVQAELVGTFGPDSATPSHAEVRQEDFLVFAGYLAASVASAARRSRSGSDHKNPDAYPSNKSDQIDKSDDDDDAAFERLVREAWGFHFPPKFTASGESKKTAAADATQPPAGMRLGYGGAVSSHSAQDPAPWSHEDAAAWGGLSSNGTAQVGGENASPPPPLHSIRTSIQGPPRVHRSTPSGLSFQLPVGATLPRTPFEELLANQSPSARAPLAASKPNPTSAAAAGIVRPTQNSSGNWCTVPDSMPFSAEEEIHHGRPPVVLVEPTSRSPPRSAREKAAMAQGVAYEGASGLGVARDEAQALALAARRAQDQARQKQYILHRSRSHHYSTENGAGHSISISSATTESTSDAICVVTRDNNLPSASPAAMLGSPQPPVLDAWSWESAMRDANAKQVAERRRAALAQQEARIAASDAAYDVAAYREALRKGAMLRANRERSAREHAAQLTARAEERDRDREEVLAWSDPGCRYHSANGAVAPSASPNVPNSGASAHGEKHYSISPPSLASARIFYDAESHAAAAESRRQAWASEAPAAWAEQAASREQQPLAIGRRPDSLLPPPPPPPPSSRQPLNATSSRSAPHDSSSSSSSSGGGGAYTEGGEFSWLKGLRDGQGQEALRRKLAEQACLEEHAKAFQDAEANRYNGRVARAGSAAAAHGGRSSTSAAAAPGGGANSGEDGLSGEPCRGNGQGSGVLNLATVRARVASAGRGDLLVHLEAPQRVDEHTLSLLLQWQPHQPLADLRLPRYGGIVARTQATYLAQLLALVHDNCSPWELNRTMNENQAPPLQPQKGNSKPLAGLQSTRALRW